jgi:hypothetical protein
MPYVNTNPPKNPSHKHESYVDSFTSEESVAFKGPLKFWKNNLYIVDEEGEGYIPPNPVTFEFPIQDTNGTTQMKNISPSTLPNFHGLSSEYLDTFSL